MTNDLEAIDKEIETPPDSGGIIGTSQQSAEQIFWLADNAQKLVDSHNKIRDAICKIAQPDDWMLFGDEDKKKATIGFAGAFRIANFLGVNFINWTEKKETGRDDRGEWYRWEYECDSMFRGRTVRVYGRFGTRDKFFGRAHGSDKAICDINEGDVKMAARRSCMKEGVKVLFGLHNLDPKYLEEKGIRLSAVGGHSFVNNSDINKISEPQGKRLWAISKAAGVSEDVLREHLKKNYNIEHSKDISRKDYEAICKWVEGQAKGS